LSNEASVVEAVTAKVPVEVAPVVVSPPLKAIVVEVAFEGNGYRMVFEMTPVEGTYEMPEPAERLVEEILLLKKFQSVEERYPLVPVPDWEMVSAPVWEFQASGAEAEMEVEARRPSDEVAMRE
jgi:hypothetical protein